MQLVEARYLILAGLLLTGGTLYEMTGFSLDTSQQTIVVTSIVQGVGPRPGVRADHHGRVRDAARRPAQQRHRRS